MMELTFPTMRGPTATWTQEDFDIACRLTNVSGEETARSWSLFSMVRAERGEGQLPLPRLHTDAQDDVDARDEAEWDRRAAQGELDADARFGMTSTTPRASAKQ
jgi:hypothetical protein